MSACTRDLCSFSEPNLSPRQVVVTERANENVLAIASGTHVLVALGDPCEVREPSHPPSCALDLPRVHHVPVHHNAATLVLSPLSLSLSAAGGAAARAAPRVGAVHRLVPHEWSTRSRHLRRLRDHIRPWRRSRAAPLDTERILCNAAGRGAPHRHVGLRARPSAYSVGGWRNARPVDPRPFLPLAPILGAIARVWRRADGL